MLGINPMNFLENKMEGKSDVKFYTSSEDFDDQDSPLFKLRLLEGHEIPVSLIDTSINSTIGVVSGTVLEGTLDKGIELGKPIYFNNGQFHTSKLIGAFTKNDKEFIKTETTTYQFSLL